MIEKININELKSKLKELKVLVIGDIMLDRYWIGDSHRISPEAPIPIVNINNSDDRLGGATNVANNLASIGVNVGVLGCIGNDDIASKIEKLLSQYNITSHLQKDKEYVSILKLRVLARKQQMIRIDFEVDMPKHMQLKIKNKFKKIVKDYDAIILSDYNKGCLKHANQLIEIANKHNIPVLVDPKGQSFKKYQNSYILTPNLKEFKAIVGEFADDKEFKEKAIKLIADLNLQALMITKSEQGISVFTKDKEFHFTAKAKEVFDVSGAGDTVIAIFTAILSITKNISLATQYANIAGGIVVSKLGTSIINKEELFNEIN